MKQLIFFFFNSQFKKDIENESSLQMKTLLNSVIKSFEKMEIKMLRQAEIKRKFLLLEQLMKLLQLVLQPYTMKRRQDNLLQIKTNGIMVGNKQMI